MALVVVDGNTHLVDGSYLLLANIQISNKFVSLDLHLPCQSKNKTQ